MSTAFINLRLRPPKYYEWPYRRDVSRVLSSLEVKAFLIFIPVTLMPSRPACCDSPLAFGRPVVYNLSGKMEIT